MLSADRAFATCADDGVVKIWDFWLHKNTNTLKGHHSDVHDVDWHPTSALVASGSKDSTVKLWDPREGVSDAVRTLRDHSQPVHKVRWNCNGNWLASASQDRSVAIWDLRMMRTLRHFKPPCSEPTAMAWHPDHESLLAVGHLGGELSYWLCSGSAAPEAARAESEAAAAVPLAHDGSIWDMAWHPTGAMLATCGHDRMLRFWSRPRPGDTPAQYEHKGGDRRRERLGPAAAALVGTRGLAQMARAGGSVGGARYDELLKSSGAVDAGAAAPEARARSAGVVGHGGGAPGMGGGFAPRGYGPPGRPPFAGPPRGPAFAGGPGARPPMPGGMPPRPWGGGAAGAPAAAAAASSGAMGGGYPGRPPFAPGPAPPRPRW